MLIETLGLRAARLISICGAGGKTTLMLALARELASTSQRVLITTTTKIAVSEGEGALPPGVSVSHLGKTADGQKLIGHPPEAIDQLKSSGQFDRVLVEADGSRHRPLKAPAAHEPVIPATSDAVIVVAGLGRLGQPLSEDNVFRADIWAALSGTAPGAPVDAGSLARVALHPDGLAKGCPAPCRIILLLNQVDTPEAAVAAAAIGALIAAEPRHPYSDIVAGRLLPAPAVSKLLKGQTLP